MNDHLFFGAGPVWAAVLIALYFVPAIIACSRHHQSSAAIAVLNLLLG